VDIFMTKAEQLAAILPQEIDGALITSAHNRRYLTGFPSSAGIVLVTKQGACFLTDSRYIEAAKRVISDMDCIEYTSETETLRELILQFGIRTIAVEGSGMTCSELSHYQNTLGGVKLQAEGLDPLLWELRLVKTEAELAKMSQAQELTEFGFDHILPFIRAGRTEREVALELEFIIRKQGAECVAFDYIVVSGANSSMPHGVPSDKVIEQGDFVTMDFGAVVDGWHSDMTRTVAVGRCSEEQKKVYQTVLTAQKAALSVLHEGLSGAVGDAAARNVIAKAGYGEFFGHGTGHGVGIEIHEAPRLSPMAGGVLLKAGSVVTVEPGIYLPGKFGVRIEDMVHVTGNGCKNFTKSPKELLIL
jgi:Xaa-Pro aminopeptidase